MVMCCVVGCSVRSDRGYTNEKLFSIPSVIKNQGEKTEALCKERRAAWLSNINRKDLTEKKIVNTRVCSQHFITGQPSSLYDITNPDWAPTLILGHTKFRKASVKITASRHLRLKARREKRNVSLCQDEAVETEKQALVPVISEDNVEPILEHNSIKVDVVCETELTMRNIHELEKEYQTCNEEIYKLREQAEGMPTNFSQESFRKSGEKVKFYTGLPHFTILMAVFNLVASCMPSSHRNKLDPFQEFVMTLIRLRLNSSVQDLAYRFQVSQATASRICNKWIDVMFVRLQKLVTWPDREMLRKTMPWSFKCSFGNRVAVVIDCFEVFIDRPSTLLPRALTWSSYKHHNTVKFLIGISPQGVITFISKAWGGRVSDKHLTENCKILDNLLPGDLVLADRGFNIADSVGFYCAELALPAFTKGKAQLSPKDVAETRKLANVRIHVERVIGLVRRKYRILQGVLPIDLLMSKEGDSFSRIDKIATVCCALTNLCDSVVPM